ncbi:MAG: hypothetical protein JJD92_07110 [Frankiaceae bacterium]|nr:hypothetical protein [Frankiaceae bacterium]
MTMLVVVMDAGSSSATLDTAAATRLRSLGITHIAIAQDAKTEAVVLEGWAFDVVGSGDEATAIVAGSARRSSLRPVLDTLLSRST